MLTFDAHLDLSLNALEYNRDLRRPVAEIRADEAGMTDLKGRGSGTVAFPEMREAGIGICVATQLAGCMKPAAPVGAWNSPAQARAMTQGQLAWYQAMEDDGHLRQLRTWPEVESHLGAWRADPDATPIGYLLSLEGADSLRSLDDLETSYTQGLRALGPAHYGTGRYALGHDREGPLSEQGLDLLRKMNELGLILDVTHLCDQTFWQALDLYQGPLWASHHNCRSLVDDPRQLADEQIKALAERGAVMGVACDVWMVVPGWERGVTTRTDKPEANLEALADHVDHYCQLLGDARSVGIGTDLDGGYGCEQTPAGLETIADLNAFRSILAGRGYSEQDLAAISHQNFLDCLKSAWT